MILRTKFSACGYDLILSSATPMTASVVSPKSVTGIVTCEVERKLRVLTGSVDQLFRSRLRLRLRQLHHHGCLSRLEAQVEELLRKLPEGCRDAVSNIPSAGLSVLRTESLHGLGHS